MKKWVQRFKFQHMRLGRKYAVPLVVTIMLFIVSTVLVAILLRGMSEEIHAVEHQADRSLKMSEMASIFHEKDIRIADFIQTLSTVPVSKFEEHQAQFDQLEQELRPYLVSEQEQHLFNQIIENDEKIRHLFMEEIIPAVNRGDMIDAQIFRSDVSYVRTDTVDLINELIALVGHEREMAVAQAKSQSLYVLNVLIASVCISVLLSIIITYFVNRMIDRNIREVIEVGNEIAKGNLAVRDIRYNSMDEIGQIATTINYMSSSLREMVSNMAIISQTVSSQSEELTQMSREVKAGSEQIATTMQELASGTEIQARSATEIAELVETLNERVDVANRDGDALNDASESVLSQAASGTVQMEQTAKQMAAINDIVADALGKVRNLESSAANISNLVSVIQDIASQTNLLALNASIEAARAGEQGRGFAVVAVEVKKLSEQVEQSVSEVTAIIADIQKDTKVMVASLQSGYEEVAEGTQSMDATKQMFDSISKSVQGMVEHIGSVSMGLRAISRHGEKIGTISQEIASISEEAAAGVEQTSASAQQQNSSMEEITNNSVHLAAQAEELNEMINKFKL